MNIAHAAEEGGISIHLAPDILGHVWGVPITNTLLTVWVSMAVILLVAIVLYRNRAMVPGKMQVAAELVVGGAYDYIKDVLGSEKLARAFFPVIMTFFVFILAINWLGLLPGVSSIGIFHEYHGEEKLMPFFYPANTDLNITIAFAIVAFIVIEFAGILLLGFLKYAGKFVNFKSPLGFIIGIIELFSELARLISFSFRLFGNIFAGKTLIVVALFFVPLVLPVPLLGFELFVGFIQAFIFAVLTLFFIKIAIEDPHAH